MKRTITVKNYDDVYYANGCIGCLNGDLQWHFNLKNGKYAITIIEGKQFQIKRKFPSSTFLHLYENGEDIGFVCAKTFSTLFFKPDGRKRYDITVTRKRGRK